MTMESLKDRFSLEGRTALVTGSARGLGRAIALGLAEHGAAVVVHGVRDSEPLAQTLSEVRKLAPRAAAVTGDLADPDAGPRIVAAATAALGAPDVLVANASLQIRRPWAEVPPEEARAQMQVNFHSTLAMIQAAVPAMRARRWGRIVSVGSIQEDRPHPDMIAYSASKSALENLVRSLAKQLGPDGVTVNNLSPGVFATDRNTEALSDPAYAEKVRTQIPLRFFGDPTDIAGAAVLLCSEAGRYITGTTIRVNGGMHL